MPRYVGVPSASFFLYFLPRRRNTSEDLVIHFRTAVVVWRRNVAHFTTTTYAGTRVSLTCTVNVTLLVVHLHDFFVFALSSLVSPVRVPLTLLHPILIRDGAGWQGAPREGEVGGLDRYGPTNFFEIFRTGSANQQVWRHRPAATRL